MLLVNLLTHKCWAQSTQDQNYKEASNKALEAAYEQTGTKKFVEDFAQRLDKEYVPDYINKHGGIVLIVYKAAKDRQLSWKWTF